MDWYARGDVYEIKPSGLTVEIVRFECSRIFGDERAAENHGLEVATKWVDEMAESFKESGKGWIGRTPCPCESKDQETLNLTRR